MKKVALLLMAVLFCSLSAWSQSSMIVKLGTEVIENNSLSYAEISFQNHGMPLNVFPSGKYGYMSERTLFMAVIDVTSNNKIKEVDFLCGITFWYEIDDKLENEGYTLESTGDVRLGNGAIVSQKTFSNGEVICIVQTLDKNTKQIIFKRATSK